MEPSKEVRLRSILDDMEIWCHHACEPVCETCERKSPDFYKRMRVLDAALDAFGLEERERWFRATLSQEGESWSREAYDAAALIRDRALKRKSTP